MNPDSYIKAVSQGRAHIATDGEKVRIIAGSLVYGTVSNDRLYIQGRGPMLTIPLCEIMSIQVSRDEMSIRDDQGNVHVIKGKAVA